MSVTDASQLAVEARDLALEEVCRLLQNPEDLTKLASLRAEYEKGRALNKLQLTALVQSRVEAVQSSKELLDRSQKAVAKLKACFEQIDRLCEECGSLVERHEKIQELAVAHHNVTKTLMEIDDVIDLPSNAGIAEEMLNDDALLMEAYKAVSSLEGTSALVQEAMKKNDRRNAEQENLRDYFDKVGLSAVKLEEKLWKHFRNFASLSVNNPGLLVACNQIVAMQEIIDSQLPDAQKKSFRRKAMDAMEQSINDKFLSAFQSIDDLEDESALSTFLKEAAELTQQLIDIYDLAEPCFPAQDDIFGRFWQWYHGNFMKLLDRLSQSSSTIDNKSILDIVRWMESYKETLDSLGIEANDVGTSIDDNLRPLIDLYIDRDKQSTTTWYLNILDSDVQSDPKLDKDEKLWTPSFVDFFRIINDGFVAVEKETHGEMLYQWTQGALQMMRDFVSAERTILQKDVPPHILVAFVNNNRRSHDLAVEFVEHFEEVTENAFLQQTETEDVYRGFLDVASFALQHLIDGIFSDPGMVALLKKLYQQDWQTGAVTQSVVDTLQDYLSDFGSTLDDAVRPRLVEAALEKTVGQYSNALVTRMPNITEAVIAQMQKDESQFTTFFGAFIESDRVEPHIYVLSSLRQLACADSVESFVLAYLSILESNPETPVSLVEKVCNARGDMSRADASDVMEQCRALFNQRQHKRTTESGQSLWNKLLSLQ